MSAHPAPRATRSMRAETAGSSGLALGPNQRGKAGGQAEASIPVMAMAHQRSRSRTQAPGHFLQARPGGQRSDPTPVERTCQRPVCRTPGRFPHPRFHPDAHGIVPARRDDGQGISRRPSRNTGERASVMPTRSATIAPKYTAAAGRRAAMMPGVDSERLRPFHLVDEARQWAEQRHEELSRPVDRRVMRLEIRCLIRVAR